MDAATLAQRQAIILAAEEALAARLAHAVLPRPKASVWMILLPPLFVFFALAMQRHKKEMAIFSNGFLFTKRLALQAVVEDILSGSHKEVEFPPPPAHVGTPSAWARIRRLEAEEVALLRQHYRRLLFSRGSSFAGLVQGAYGTPGEYQAFCNALRRAEVAVTTAMLEELHPTPEAREAAQTMESALEELRQEQIRHIFGMQHPCHGRKKSY